MKGWGVRKEGLQDERRNHGYGWMDVRKNQCQLWRWEDRGYQGSWGSRWESLVVLRIRRVVIARKMGIPCLLQITEVVWKNLNIWRRLSCGHRFSILMQKTWLWFRRNVLSVTQGIFRIIIRLNRNGRETRTCMTTCWMAEASNGWGSGEWR